MASACIKRSRVFHAPKCAERNHGGCIVAADGSGEVTGTSEWNETYLWESGRDPEFSDRYGRMYQTVCLSGIIGE
ncbi:hypothetical protein HZ326_20747 [Fusarium oxysporum f. sp. albedinis]|nr:hypothetical protein HZ326_20747 [Fusarium oxysporum f. sp. albedinis]